MSALFHLYLCGHIAAEWLILMKRSIIGGFLSLIGTIWSLAIILFAGNNLVSAWATPPGRFWSTVIETGMLFPMVLAIALLVLGLLVLGIEYFRKGE